MAKKPTIATVASGYQGTVVLNESLQALRDAFDNTISRDGSTPNSMSADLDLNGNDIINVNSVDAASFKVGGVDLTSALTESVTTAENAAQSSINFVYGVAFTANTLAAGSPATVSYDPDTINVTIGLPVGADGTSGSKWYSGTGAPSGASYLVGDWYLNDANGDVYEKTATSTWTLRDNLTGPGGSGSGDMSRSVYDTDNNGIVDAAATVPWSGVSSTPTTIAGYGITDFTETAQDVVGTLLTGSEATGDLDWTYTDASNTLTAVVKSGVVTLSKIDTTGTSGYVMTAQGTGAAPIWAAPASASGTGGLLRTPRVLTSGTSYTTPANCNSIFVEVIGGGGGGGGASNFGGGGGSGAYTSKYFPVTPSTLYTNCYTIGAAGSGGLVNATGGTGGSSTFTLSGTTVTAAGGVGGPNGTNNINGGLGGVATNGDMNIRGNAGTAGSGGYFNSPSATTIVTAAPYTSGSGGNSFFGGSANGVYSATGTTVAGIAGLTGSGGSGAAGTTGTGGAGGGGIIRIWEYS